MNNQNAFQECVHYAELGEIEKISLGIFDNTEKIDVILTDLFECKNFNIEKPSSEKLLKIFSLCFAFSNIDLWPRDLREKNNQLGYRH